ncbi:hypothetical protein [Allosphingosinicella sp.]|uniref:hypothetical protein n=1 Tax=Allosphingosinicella sp. TaxID=2823234 RepID=UPI003784DFBE
MRKILIPLAALGTVALVALPAAAQQRTRHQDQQREEQTLRGGAEAMRQAGPMLDRSANSALQMDIGPLLDALHPYGRQGRHMTLGQLGRANDPDFDAKLHRSIYRGTQRAAATLDAMATAAPSIRQSLRQMEAAIAGAMVEARRPLPRDGYRYEAPREDYDAPPPPPPPGDEDDDDGAPW